MFLKEVYYMLTKAAFIVKYYYHVNFLEKI